MKDNFEKHGVIAINNLIQDNLLEFVSHELHLLEEASRIAEQESLDQQGDNACELCFARYGVFAGETLLDLLAPAVSDLIGKKVEPSFSYYRHYRKDAELEEEPSGLDGPKQYCVTLCLDTKRAPWEVTYNIDNGDPWSIALDKNVAVISRGDIVTKREKYLGNSHKELYLYYVDDGSEWVGDGRETLGLAPAEQEEEFF